MSERLPLFTSPAAGGTLKRRLTAIHVLALSIFVIVTAQAAAYFLIEGNRTERTALDAQVATLADLSDAVSTTEDALHNVAGHESRGEAVVHFYTSLRDVEAAVARLSPGGDSPALSARTRADLAMLIAGWRQTVAAYEQRDDARAVAYLTLPAAEQAMKRVQHDLGDTVARGRAESTRRSLLIRTTFTCLFWFQIGSVTLLVLAIGRAYRQVQRESEARRKAIENEAGTRRRLELLFGMHDMLQAAEDHRDANLILSATASELAPGAAGALYVFNNSGDRLNLSTHWGSETSAFPAFITPNECWALKRGKPHLNGDPDNSLRCVHAGQGTGIAIEVPMIARGNILGMLVMIPLDEAPQDLSELRLVATALADGMSLALSNMALRERLRNQALRDGLTGLYNRRYMEDALERVFDASGPGAPPSSIVMIDLDHFKRINDDHGHAVGDNILRDVGPLLLSGLRKADVACRYGGEELVIVLPNCEHEQALSRAEVIRTRIEQLSENYGFRISASLGVATSGQHGRTVPALLSAADEALYSAKSNGRNRVMSANPARALLEGVADDFPVAAE